MEQISQNILAEHQKKQEIMASIYSGRCNRKSSSHCHVEKTLFSIAELIKKLWNWHQNIISHGNFEGIYELMCNSFKITSLLHKLPLNRAAGKDGIFAEHIFYADSSVCNHLSSLFNVCLTVKSPIRFSFGFSSLIILLPPRSRAPTSHLLTCSSTYLLFTVDE